MMYWTEWADGWNASAVNEDHQGDPGAAGSSVDAGGVAAAAATPRVRTVELLAQIHDELLFECKDWAVPQVGVVKGGKRTNTARVAVCLVEHLPGTLS